jgi:hypothetical protein
MPQIPLYSKKLVIYAASLLFRCLPLPRYDFLYRAWHFLHPFQPLDIHDDIAEIEPMTAGQKNYQNNCYPLPSVCPFIEGEPHLSLGFPFSQSETASFLPQLSCIIFSTAAKIQDILYPFMTLPCKADRMRVHDLFPSDRKFPDPVTTNGKSGPSGDRRAGRLLIPITD